MTPEVGCTELREWLVSQGFRTAVDMLANRENQCNWYAYRPSSLPARACECNAGKRMQVVVKPYAYGINGVAHETVEVEVVGEAGGVWVRHVAYSIPHAELKRRLDAIEHMLIAAWNAMLPAQGRNTISARRNTGTGS